MRSLQYTGKEWVILKDEISSKKCKLHGISFLVIDVDLALYIIPNI
jgi:hypothetical protein